MTNTEGEDMEEWRAVPGWEGYYEVSGLGRVRSMERTVPSARWGTHRVRSRILRPRVNVRQGYLMVALYKDRVRRDIAIHVLVAAAWHGPRPDGMDVCHANDIKTDNRPENLRYGTRSENLLDAVRNGINYYAKKTHCKNGHEFTPENTAYIAPPGRRPYRRCRTCARLRTARGRRASLVAA